MKPRLAIFFARFAVIAIFALAAVILCANVFPRSEDGVAASKEVAALVASSDYRQLLGQRDGWKHLSKEVKRQLVYCLVERLGSAKELGLENYADLIIPSRPNMIGGGHGAWIDQDIFLENGRCAWAIEQILEIKLPRFTEGMPPEKLQAAVHESIRRIDQKTEIPLRHLPIRTWWSRIVDR